MAECFFFFKAVFIQLFGEGNGNPRQCSCLENPRDGGAWWAAVYGVAQSWTRLKRLSSIQLLSCVWIFETSDQVFLSFTISWSLLKLMSIESVIPSNLLILCCSLLLLPSIFPSIRSFPVSWLFTSGCLSIGASASALVLPMNIQGWYLLGWTGLISLQSKGLYIEFSLAPQFKSINSSALSLLCGLTLTFILDYRKKRSFDYTNLCQQSDVSAF